MNETKVREADTAFWTAHHLRPREHQVRLASTGTRVRIQELGEGPPILFLHGSQCAGSDWAPLLEHLSGSGFTGRGEACGTTTTVVVTADQA